VITATICKLWGQDWEKLEAGHGNGVWARRFILPGSIRTELCGSSAD
jgi:hypothetical protein